MLTDFIDESDPAAQNKSKAREFSLLPYILQEVFKNVYTVQVENLKDSIRVDNLDEVKASLANELKKTSKELTKVIKELNQDRYSSVLKKIEDNTAKTVSEIKVSNLGEIKFPETKDIVFPEFPKETNLSKETIDELRKYFLNLGSHIAKSIAKVSVNPQVNVEVPQQPAPIVHVPEVDLSPILAGLAPLERLFNDENEPINVRISGIEEFVKNIQDSNNRLAAGFSGGVSDVYVKAPGGERVDPSRVSFSTSNSDGWDTFLATSSDGSTALTNSAQAVKASAGLFGGYYIYNPNSSATYVHVYNVGAASVTVGTTNPKNTYVIPATSAANLEIVRGLNYNTAISVSATTTGGGSTAPTTALEANFWYK